MVDRFIEEKLKELREALSAYEFIVDELSERDEELFSSINRGKFPQGDTILSKTYFKDGLRPKDNVLIIQGYLAAKLGEVK